MRRPLSADNRRYLAHMVLFGHFSEYLSKRRGISPYLGMLLNLVQKHCVIAFPARAHVDEPRSQTPPPPPPPPREHKLREGNINPILVTEKILCA